MRNINDLLALSTFTGSLTQQIGVSSCLVCVFSDYQLSKVFTVISFDAYLLAMYPELTRGQAQKLALDYEALSFFSRCPLDIRCFTSEEALFLQSINEKYRAKVYNDSTLRTEESRLERLFFAAAALGAIISERGLRIFYAYCIRTARKNASRLPSPEDSHK